MNQEKITNKSGRQLYFYYDDDGIYIRERNRYAPRKYDEQRVFLTFEEVVEIVDRIEQAHTRVPEGRDPL